MQRVNEQALQSFERDEDLSESLTVMTRMILPTLAMVGGSDLAEDQAVVERIRGVWCQFLEKDLTGDVGAVWVSTVQLPVSSHCNFISTFGCLNPSFANSKSLFLSPFVHDLVYSNP